MTITTIHDAIRIIRDFPYADESSARMVRVLSEHAGLFAAGAFQFNVSMGVYLSVLLDDGYHGIRGVEERNQGWFTFGPDQRKFVLRTGFGSEILIEREASEQEVGSLLADGIRHLVENSKQ